MPNKTTPSLLQLEARPKVTDAFMQNWEAYRGFCQPPMVFDTLLPGQSEETNSEDSTNNTLVENPIMVSIGTGATLGTFLNNQT